MAKVFQQVSTRVFRSRKQRKLSDEEIYFRFIDLAEHLKQMADQLEQWPSDQCMFISNILMKLRDTMQSVPLLRSHNLSIAPLALLRGALETAIVSVNVIIFNEFREFNSETGRYSRINIHDECNRLSTDAIDNAYPLYNELSKIAHVSSTYYDSSFKELDIYIKADGSVTADNNDMELLSKMHSLFDEIGRNLLPVITDLYYLQPNMNPEEIKSKVATRYILRFLNYNSGMIKNCNYMDWNEVNKLIRESANPALVKQGIFNDDNSPGPMMREAFKEELTQVSERKKCCTEHLAACFS